MQLEQARLYVQAEDERANGIQTRAATVAAAAGLVLGLTVTTGSDLVTRQVDEGTLQAVFILSLLFLLTAGGLAGFALWPQRSWAAQAEVVKGYAERDLRAADAETQADRLMAGLTQQLTDTRHSNDRLTNILRWAFGALGVGLICAAVLGAKLGVGEPTAPDRGQEVVGENHF